MRVKSAKEMVSWIASNYNPYDQERNKILYESFDNECGINGLPWLERQTSRLNLAKQINTFMRRESLSIDGEWMYLSLMVSDRGASFLLAKLPCYAIKDYHRSCRSAATIIDSVNKDISKLLGRESYYSPVASRQVSFRGARPILNQNERSELERACEQLEIVAPLITSLLAAANSAIRSYHRLIGPQQDFNQQQLEFDGNHTAELKEAA